MGEYLNLIHLILRLNVWFIVNQFRVGDWLVEGKPALTIGWASRDFWDLQMHKYLTLNLMLQNSKCSSIMACFLKQKKQLNSGACKFFKCLIIVWFLIWVLSVSSNYGIDFKTWLYLEMSCRTATGLFKLVMASIKMNFAYLLSVWLLRTKWSYGNIVFWFDPSNLWLEVMCRGVYAFHCTVLCVKCIPLKKLHVYY